MSSPNWNPEQYRRFAADRDRAATDLMARLPGDLNPDDVWDLGCGEGAHAVLLAERYPHARVFGIDSSETMIEAARARGGRVEWSVGDVAAWTPERPAGLIWSNAALQWLDGHEALFPRLAGCLTPSGVLAVQMPLGHETPHHAALRSVAADGPWAEVLAGVRRTPPLASVDDYFDRLSPLCEPVDIWTTTYIHVLSGDRPVLEWMKGTALRPYLTALTDPALREAFLSALGERLSRTYPPLADGRTLLPFPRLFLVARRR